MMIVIFCYCPGFEYAGYCGMNSGVMKPAVAAGGHGQPVSLPHRRK